MITLEPQGLPEAQRLLKMIERIGSIKAMVQYEGGSRADGKASNAEVLKGHAEGIETREKGKKVRDVIGPGDELQGRLEKELIKVIEAGIKREQQSGVLRVDKSGKVKAGKSFVKQLKSGKSKLITAQKVADGIMARGFKKMAFMWKLNIGDLIRDQKDVNGASLLELEPDYAELKQRLHGRTKPILVATGQILDSISHDMGGIRFKAQK